MLTQAFKCTVCVCCSKISHLCSFFDSGLFALDVIWLLSMKNYLRPNINIFSKSNEFNQRDANYFIHF